MTIDADWELSSSSSKRMLWPFIFAVLPLQAWDWRRLCGALYRDLQPIGPSGVKESSFIQLWVEDFLKRSSFRGHVFKSLNRIDGVSIAGFKGCVVSYYYWLFPWGTLWKDDVSKLFCDMFTIYRCLQKRVFFGGVCFLFFSGISRFFCTESIRVVLVFFFFFFRGGDHTLLGTNISPPKVCWR